MCCGIRNPESKFGSFLRSFEELFPGELGVVVYSQTKTMINVQYFQYYRTKNAGTIITPFQLVFLCHPLVIKKGSPFAIATMLASHFLAAWPL